MLVSRPLVKGKNVRRENICSLGTPKFQNAGIARQGESLSQRIVGELENSPKLRIGRSARPCKRIGNKQEMNRK